MKRNICRTLYFMTSASSLPQTLLSSGMSPTILAPAWRRPVRIETWNIKSVSWEGSLMHRVFIYNNNWWFEEMLYNPYYIVMFKDQYYTVVVLDTDYRRFNRPGQYYLLYILANIKVHFFFKDYTKQLV
jgi:hypothetical protein